MAAKLTTLAHKITIQLHLVAECCTICSSRSKVANPETFGYTLGSTRRYNSRVSSVGIALGYGLDERGSTVRFPAGAGNFSLHHRIQNGSGAHPTSYPMGTRGSFPGGIAAGA
jgi:hypothetical protein